MKKLDFCVSDPNTPHLYLVDFGLAKRHLELPPTPLLLRGGGGGGGGEAGGPGRPSLRVVPKRSVVEFKGTMSYAPYCAHNKRDQVFIMIFFNFSLCLSQRLGSSWRFVGMGSVVVMT